MLKLECLTDTSDLSSLEQPELDPMENKPFFPRLPEHCWTSLPAIWSGKHTTKDFQKNPILKVREMIPVFGLPFYRFTLIVSLFKNSSCGRPHQVIPMTGACPILHSLFY